MSKQRPRRIYLSTRRRRRRFEAWRSPEGTALIVLAVCGLLAWALFALLILH